MTNSNFFENLQGDDDDYVDNTTELKSPNPVVPNVDPVKVEKNGSEKKVDSNVPPEGSDKNDPDGDEFTDDSAENDDPVDESEEGDDEGLNIDESVIAGSLVETVKAIEGFDDFDAKTTKVDEFVRTLYSYQEEKIKADPKFIEDVKADVIHDYGLDEDTVSRSLAIKGGVDVKKYTEAQHLLRFSELDPETDNELELIFKTYHVLSNVSETNVQKYVKKDLEGSDKFELAKEYLSEIKKIAEGRISEYDSEAEDKISKEREYRSEMKKKVTDLLSKRTIGGQTFTKDQIDKYNALVKDRTTEITLPNGSKKMVSELQAREYNEMSTNLEAYMARMIKNALRIEDSSEIMKAEKKTNKTRGVFMSNLENSLSKAKIKPGRVQEVQKTKETSEQFEA